MSKHIIAFKGKSNVGKTEVITKVRDLLLEESEVEEIKYEKKGKDFIAILIFSGQQIGLISQGDWGEGVRDNFKKIQQEQFCEIIMCATRTRGKTVNVIKEYDPQYKITWLKQIKCEGQKNQEQNNEKMAHKIVDLIKQKLVIPA